MGNDGPFGDFDLSDMDLSLTSLVTDQTMLRVAHGHFLSSLQ